MTDPGLPLTTGEGNTAQEKLRYLATGDGDFHPLTSDDAKALLAECGRLRAWHEEWVEATARAHGRLREQLALTEKQRRIFEELAKLNASERADKAEAERDALREQLDARDKAAKEEAHWHVHYAAEAAAQKNRCDKCGTHISEWNTKPCVKSLTQSPRHSITRFHFPLPARQDDEGPVA